MKLLQKLIACLCLLILTAKADAQTTITLASIPAPGTYVVNTNGSTGNVQAGDSGAGLIWDYRTVLHGLTRDTTYYMLPSATPYAGQLGNAANFASLSGFQYQFYNRNATQFALSAVIADAGIPGITNLTFKLNPTFTLLRFPATYGNTYHTVSKASYAFPIDSATVAQLGSPVPLDSIKVELTLTGDSRINGSGELLLPGPGEEYPCLRQQIKETTTQKIYGYTYIVLFGNRFYTWIALPIDIPGFTQTYINYWTPAKTAPVLSMLTDSAGNASNITFQSNAPLAGTDAKTATGKLGVYPNPSGGVFNIQIPTSINSASGAELFVTDALGRNILRKPIQAGTNSVQQLDLQGNSPGLYRVVLSNSTGNKLGSASVMLK